MKIWNLVPYVAASIDASPSTEAGYHRHAGVLQYVNPKIGTYGVTPNGNGGMIPSTSPPFAMTRWTPQTRENYISQCPYNDLDGFIHGFQATHQPAIWMGESGQVVVSPGIGDVRPSFVDRAHAFSKIDERSTAYVYEVSFAAQSITANGNLTESLYSPVPGGEGQVPTNVESGANGRTRRDLPASATEAPGFRHLHRAGSRMSATAPDEADVAAVNKNISAAMTGTSHVGFLKFEFPNSSEQRYVFIQATRQNWTGHVAIDNANNEISGSNSERQDYALGPLHAKGFRSYFVSRFSHNFTSCGTSSGDSLQEGALSRNHSGNGIEGDPALGAFVRFDPGTKVVEVRTGISFISVEQARRNLDLEGPASMSFDDAVEELKASWLEKIGRVKIEGVNQTDSNLSQRTTWYTGLFHALQYPSDFSEPSSKQSGGTHTFYSGYTDSAHVSNDSYYQSWSIWDTFRAEHSILTLFAPERVNSMMRTLLNIYDWSGRLPMWANMVETNIMVGTHVDAVLANALERGFNDFNVSKAWEAVKKNAFVPPENDTELLYFDREGWTPDEVRAGLTTYGDPQIGYVANDRWSESGSRTLDYAFDDYAASVVATHAGDHQTSAQLLNRSQNYRTLWNNATGFMEARNFNGTFAGSDQGWTEGDDWIYSFSVMHDPKGLAQLYGGPAEMKAKLDEYFNGGHNDQSNEPSHHAPYMYAAIGYPTNTQNLTRQIAADNYNATTAGLSGNEDLGQMSAWYIFSALGFYPVNPASTEYVVGSPFFEKVSIRLPAGAATGGVGGKEHTLTVSAPGAPTNPFVKGLKVDGQQVDKPILLHNQLVTANLIEFDMSNEPQTWGNSGI